MDSNSNSIRVGDSTYQIQSERSSVGSKDDAKRILKQNEKTIKNAEIALIFSEKATPESFAQLDQLRETNQKLAAEWLKTESGEGGVEVTKANSSFLGRLKGIIKINNLMKGARGITRNLFATKQEKLADQFEKKNDPKTLGKAIGGWTRTTSAEIASLSREEIKALKEPAEQLSSKEVGVLRELRQKKEKELTPEEKTSLQKLSAQSERYERQAKITSKIEIGARGMSDIHRMCHQITIKNAEGKVVLSPTTSRTQNSAQLAKILTLLNDQYARREEDKFPEDLIKDIEKDDKDNHTGVENLVSNYLRSEKGEKLARCPLLPLARSLAQGTMTTGVATVMSPLNDTKSQKYGGLYVGEDIKNRKLSVTLGENSLKVDYSMNYQVLSNLEKENSKDKVIQKENPVSVSVELRRASSESPFAPREIALSKSPAMIKA